MKKIISQIILLVLIHFTVCDAATKTSVNNGSWNTAGSWSPSGLPTSSDSVVIATGHTFTMNTTSANCKSLNIQSSATLTINNAKTVTISGIGGLTVSGTLTMSGGNITLSTSGATFALKAGSTFTWNPGTNTLAGATLFTNGAENFATTSTLIISKWYSTTVGIGSVVSGNFGNLKIMTGTTWKMNNTLQSHQVVGALTVQSSYVILDTTGTISNTTIGSIVLSNSSSYLDFYNGTHPGSFTVNTASITISGGELDCYYTSGTGNCTLNVSGNIAITGQGILKGANNHSGNTTINVSGNVDLTKSYIIGSSSGNGNSTISIGGNLTLLKSGSTYSEFYNIVDGNGNASLTITGNFSNQGYFDLIWNTGVTGVGNGNATMTVGGTFTQSDGDFRGIWNLTTTNAGSCDININTINFTGGIFMVYYACTGTTLSNSLTVPGNLTITFSNSSDKFRGNGLGTLLSTTCIATFNLTVVGTISISGNSSAEFASSVAEGNETITTGGNISLSGAIARFQYGNHTFTWNHTGNITVSGGTNYLSTESGSATINISGNLLVSSGILSVKGKSGAVTFNIGGSYTQTGGTFNLYNNSSSAGTENITVNIANDFSHTGGTINYADNSSNTGIYSINLNGDDYTIGGTGSITSVAGTLYGYLNFNRSGTINFNRTAITHNIQQVKQEIKNGTTLSLVTGNLQVASAAIAGTDFLTINSGGILIADSKQIVSNATAANSGITVASNGTLKTANINGLYDGTTSATISSTGSMNFYLDANSIIEYNGSDNQVITGMGNGVATQTQHKYGILKINFAGTSDVEYTYLNTANTNVRTQLQLIAGELRLNNYMLIIEDGNSSAITRTSGYLKSETNNAINNSILKWMNLASGLHTFPFGVNSTNYIPVSFTASSGTGGAVEISTRATTSDNTPLTGLSHVAAVTNLSSRGTDVSVENVIDRWWVIKATGFTADVTLTYLASENSTSSGNATGEFKIQAWTGSTWSSPFGSGTGTTSGSGTVTAYGVSSFSPFVLVSSNGALPIKLLRFDAKLNDTQVDLSWSTAEEKNNDYFTIERSEDGNTFHEVTRQKGAGNSSVVRNYSSIDQNPSEGKSYYRLKQTDFNGAFTYSPIRVVTRNNSSTPVKTSMEILSIGPNPFRNQFTLNYNLEDAGEVRIMLYNMSGQLVFDQSRNDDQGNNSFDFIDENNLPPGNYILNVISGAEKITRKLVKTTN